MTVEFTRSELNQVLSILSVSFIVILHKHNTRLINDTLILNTQSNGLNKLFRTSVSVFSHGLIVFWFLPTGTTTVNLFTSLAISITAGGRLVS